MATFGRRNEGEDENDAGEGLTKWPLEYVKETKECVCGWCGRVLIPSHTDETPETHFQSCKNSKENGMLMGFKDLLKLNQKFKGLDAVIQTRVDTMKVELMEEIKTHLDKKFLDLKSDLKKDLERDLTSTATTDVAQATMLNKFKVLEEKVREMSVDQERKMAEVNGRVSGVTETVSSVIYSMVEVKGKESKDPDELDRLKKETEAFGVQLRQSERAFQTTKTELKNEVERLKTRAETFSKQLKTNDQDCQLLKRKLKDEESKHLAKKKIFHLEPSSFDQLTIPMTCFNLVTQNYLFQPSYRWIIDDIQAITAQKTFEMSSQMFQWNGYPVQARAKLQPKANDWIYLSLSLNGAFIDESQPKDLKLIPQVYYLLKSINLRKPKHACSNTSYLFKAKFKYSCVFETFLCRKFWFKTTDYNVNDSIEVEIYVEPPLMTQLVHSYNGTLNWKIENYKKRLQLEKDNLIFFQESPYFYTGPSGYRVQVRMYLNGHEGGSGPTARVLFLSGKCDAQLLNSFPHSTTLTLINRKDPERSINKTIVNDVRNKKKYTFQICEFEEMENLFENDTLFCKVVIEAH